jgi:predicted DNA-binding transcriptional regulator AlpA
MPKTDVKSPKIDQDLAARLMRLLVDQPAELPKLDRLVSTKQFCEVTGWDRGTALRAEAQEQIPRRRQLPNGRMVFLGSEVAEWLKSLPLAPLPFAARRELVQRILS